MFFLPSVLKGFRLEAESSTGFFFNLKQANKVFWVSVCLMLVARPFSRCEKPEDSSRREVSKIIKKHAHKTPQLCRQSVKNFIFEQGKGAFSTRVKRGERFSSPVLS